MSVKSFFVLINEHGTVVWQGKAGFRFFLQGTLEPELIQKYEIHHCFVDTHFCDFFEIICR